MKSSFLTVCLLCASMQLSQAQKIYPGADEKTPSRSWYESWINNTNEGPTEKQSLINLEFFEWLHKEYGMTLDIYGLSAGFIDGKNFYGSMDSPRFRRTFPNGLDAVFEKAKSIGTRLGTWGGPDGFGDTPASAKKRIDEFVSLARNYNWALLKLDAVCGQLPPERVDYFIEMMEGVRSYSPDLIFLNHRLELGRGMPYATTFLWEGVETYIDVHIANKTTAPHNRAGALSRGLVPGLQRLTEDHGVCLSSCLDYWEDDLILQAFNRSLILSPQIYGNPWFLSDNEYPKLARIFNLHRTFRSILVNGMVLPESYGPSAVSRGNATTRLITLRNLGWTEQEYTVRLNEEIGLTKGKTVSVRLFHPVERMVGRYEFGDRIKVAVPPFRSLLLFVSSENKYDNEPGIEGIDYEIVKNIPQKPVEIKLLGLPGTTAEIKLPKGIKAKKVSIDGKDYPELTKGNTVKLQFEGEVLKHPYHRKLVNLNRQEVSDDASALYEATVFAADNNALEVRSLMRSGKTRIPAVQAARDAFFYQPVFVDRGVWDRNLFDGDMKTGFWPSRRFVANQKIRNGCFRLDLGKTIYVDSLVFRVNDEYCLQPLLFDEGNFVYISSDLQSWKTITFLAAIRMVVPVGEQFRYLKMNPYPDAISEIEAYAGGQKIDATGFRASNLFADSRQMRCVAMWSNSIVLDEIAENSYLSVALNGMHGVEGAYAAIKVDGKLVGAPDRATSYPSNTWEYIVVQSNSNYTYFFHIDKSMKNKKIEIFVMGYNRENLNINPEVWICAYPAPYNKKTLIINN